MTVHSCRNLNLGGTGGYSSGSYDTMWALNAFMQGVLLYTFQSSAGNIPPPAYNVFTASYPGPSSSYITLNQGACIIPGTTGSVGQAAVIISKDAFNLSMATGNSLGEGPIGLWLAIRSANNPLANSGIFAVTSASLSTNTLYIDYRSTSSFPPVETTQMLTCSFWLPAPGSDNANPGRTGTTYAQFVAMTGNGIAGEYQTQGAATMPRIILTSPDPSAYQVRLAMESTYDREYGGLGGGFASVVLTAIPGFSGSAGDFPNMTYAAPSSVAHLHALQWRNTYEPVSSLGDTFVGTLCGHDVTLTPSAGDQASGSKANHGFYAWGNDQTGACVLATRGQPQINSGTIDQVSVFDTMTAFGLPEDETFPLPPSSIQRLFVIGKATTNSEDQVDWLCGCTTQDGTTGLAYSLDLKAGPITCVMASYVYASTQDANTNGIRYDTGAGDTPFLSATEVIPVDLIAGTWGNLYASNSAYPQVFNLEPRRMGRFPIARQGRSFGQPKWSTVDTAKQWYHISNGFYLPWGGV